MYLSEAATIGVWAAYDETHDFLITTGTTLFMNAHDFPLVQCITAH